MQAQRIELTYHSNAIEGNTLSLRETQLVLEGKSPAAQHDLREIYEARNHDRAYQLIETWAKQMQRRTLTERDILNLHATILTDIDRDAGRFRSERVRIAGTGFIPPSREKFEWLLPEMLTLASRSDIHPLLQSAELHYNLVAIHPFHDGNGRTARLLMNDHLLTRNLPPVVIRVDRRGEYLSALDDANRGNLLPFATHVAVSAISSIQLLLG